MTTPYAVAVAGNIFSPDKQTDANPTWVKAISAAHRKDQTYCLCDRISPVKLTIRHYGAETPNSHYGIASWPGTGLEHSSDCRFFGEGDDDAGAAGTKPAFQEMEDGAIRVYLARSTEVVERAKAADAKPEGRKSKPTAARQRAPDVALLNRLWRAASLNIHDNHDKRAVDWFRGSLRLLHASKRFIVDRAGHTLAERILLGASATAEAAAKHNATVIADAVAAKRELFVLGRLKQATPAQLDKPSFLLPLLDFHALPKVLVDAAIYKKFLQGRRFFNNLICNRAGEVIVICRIAPNGGEWWKCLEIAGFAASPRLIPVESSYELRMEAHLVEQERTFVKPMHIEEMGAGSEQRPDFILLDTKPRTMIEVWGMQTPEYLAQKALRIAKYQEMKRPLVSWMADQGDCLPGLPPKTVTIP